MVAQPPVTDSKHPTHAHSSNQRLAADFSKKPFEKYFNPIFLKITIFLSLMQYFSFSHFFYEITTLPPNFQILTFNLKNIPIISIPDFIYNIMQISSKTQLFPKLHFCPHFLLKLTFSINSPIILKKYNPLSFYFNFYFLTSQFYFLIQYFTKIML